MNWTKEQEQAIYEKGSNILVAAGAGSGKTAVLVERIIHKIIDEKIDIDKILVVTFTNAAASEMRGRVLEAIYKKIEENPENEHLQKQIILLSKSNICTIHSFCLDVIKNHFYELDIPANFKIGEQAEFELLKQDVIEELFEKKYEEENREFVNLLETYTNYRGDEPLKELILSLYSYIQSSPFPFLWIEEMVKSFDLQNLKDNDISNTLWGKFIIDIFHKDIENVVKSLKQIQKKLSIDTELQKFYIVISSDIEKIENLQKMDSWDQIYNEIKSIKFDRWPTDKKVISELKDIAKVRRDDVKKSISKIKDNYFLYNSEQCILDLKRVYVVLNSVKDLIIEFSNNYAKAKKEKNMIDFNDIEHFALDILVKEKNGEQVPSDVAKRYQEKFEEIAIDEYQDSNLVQEYILTTISRGNNIFMVGDVKQSIYKFRQARPELFIKKYQEYKLKDEKKENENLKIKLFKNFRSREHILKFTNQVFKNLMSYEIGDIDYNDSEYLNFGADYPEGEYDKEKFVTELNIINLKENVEDELDDIEVENEERIENVELEAKFVSDKINNLIDSGLMIYDKRKGYRKVTYKDIVILLRATNLQSPVYEKELIKHNIPVFSDTSESYLESIEIQTIMSLLKIIDNPMQDIPLVTVLRSPIVGFTDNELVLIRMERKNMSFYNSIREYQDCVRKKDKLTEEEYVLLNKIDNFLNKLQDWREKEEYTPINELIWQIYMDTGYYFYVSLMPSGNIRVANLKMLFERAKEYENASFKGLFNFINFIEKLQISSGDLGAAKLIGENENVVRIMSIHKSKGLEFPVVILAGMGKGFNLRDLNSPILLHQNFGFGPKCIDTENKLEYTTIAREAIKEKNKLEMLSEEMRVLYVAFTRAKEKLIMTGVTKDLEKSISQKKELLDMYNNDNKINSSIIKKHKTYLDWLELAYLNSKKELEGILEINTFLKNELIGKLNNEKETKKRDWIEYVKTKSIDKDKIRDINKIINWKYPFLPSTKIITKTSVSKLKEESSKEELIENKISLENPKFLEENNISATQKGSLVHLCLQKLHERNDYTINEIKELIQNLVSSNIITEKEAESIDINTIFDFTKSSLWSELKNAKQVFKEIPFYINIPAKEIYEENIDEQILVQGVIDLYYINDNGEIVLVDYKTDYVPNKDEKILIDKYSKQLEIYKRALKECYNKDVNKVYIYSTFLKKQIPVSFNNLE